MSAGPSPGSNGEASRLAGRRPALEARARVLSAVRRWFQAEGFLEVEVPARVRAPGQELHLDAFPSPSPGPTAGEGASGPRWLVTSPEYAMKRLCGAGYERIVSIGKCWRADESGPHHQPEFTMIEWYRAGAPLERIAADCQALVRLAAVEAAPAAVLDSPPGLGGVGAAGSLSEAVFARRTVRDLLREHAGVHLEGDESASELAEKARAVGVQLGGAQQWDDVFFQIWLDRVEPRLSGLGPVVVFDWPAPLGALARRRADDPRFVERFELYAGGLELANAFGELTDADEQRARFEAESAERRRRGKVTYPIDEALLSALGRMPPTAGVALGFDRLMMLVLNAPAIRHVMAFADDEV